MERDLALFPDDSCGDALWKMLEQGDDLTESREVEFSVIFQTEELALKFGHLLLENNQKLSFCHYNGDEDYPWEITAYPEMAPSYENIRAYEQLLITSSAPLNGKYDGWYCVTPATLPY